MPRFVVGAEIEIEVEAANEDEAMQEALVTLDQEATFSLPGCHSSFRGGLAAGREALNLEAQVRCLPPEPLPPGVAQTVARLLREQEVGGSRPSARID